MNDQVRFYMTLMTGLGFLTMIAYLAGAWVSLAYRRLSRSLIVVAIGFAGEFLSSSIGQIHAMIWRFPQDDALQSSLLVASSLNVISLLSRVMLVFGLVATLEDIGRKHVLSMKSNPLDEIL